MKAAVESVGKFFVSGLSNFPSSLGTAVENFEPALKKAIKDLKPFVSTGVGIAAGVGCSGTVIGAAGAGHVLVLPVLRLAQSLTEKSPDQILQESFRGAVIGGIAGGVASGIAPKLPGSSNAPIFFVTPEYSITVEDAYGVGISTGFEKLIELTDPNSERQRNRIDC